MNLSIYIGDISLPQFLIKTSQSIPYITYRRSTSRLPRAYCSRSRWKSRSAVRSRSRCRYRSVSTIKSRRSRFNSPSLSRRSHSHGSRRDRGRRSRRSHRSNRGHRSRSKTVNRRPQGRSRRSLSVSSGRSHVSLEPEVRLGFQKENDPSSFGSSNTTNNE